MAKKGFKRGLSPETLPAVKAFLNTDIGQYIKNDDRFQICIREEYINVYYNGSSIIKYTPHSDKFEIHYKYTNEPKSKLYIELERKGNDLVANKFSLFDLIKEPDAYIKRPCGEKKYLAQYLKSDQAPTIIDLEIAYTCKSNKFKKRELVANRIDLAVIEDGFMLRLIEIKIDTDSRLRAEKDGDQKIFSQMRSYSEFMKVEAPNILSSYKTIAQNIIDLGLVHKMNCSAILAAENLASFFSKGSLHPEPVLLIVDTGKSKIGRNKVDHWARLLTQFEESGFQPPRTWKP